MADVLAESMGGGTMFRRQVIQREISRALVLQPLWPKKRCEKHRQDIFVLDTAFALIEAHPATERAPSLVTYPFQSRSNIRISVGLSKVTSIVMNLSYRVGLMLALLCALAFAASAQDQQSLGDVAKAQRQKKSNAKVIDDDEMARRGIHHNAGDAMFDCDADCMQEVKRGAQYNKYFKGMTEEQWQTAFAAAKDELAPGDWSQRLSGIEQEYCRTPGKVDFAKAKSLTNDMFAKFNLESVARKIDTMAMIAHPDDASGAEALRQWRIENLAGGILHEKLTRIQQKCYVPGTQDTSAAH